MRCSRRPGDRLPRVPAPKKLPTADDYALAIVASCRITGEDPLQFTKRLPGFRARHFALHALLEVFPDAQAPSVSAALACPGKSHYFRRSSLWYVLGEAPQPGQAGRKPEPWWSTAKMGLVVKVLKARSLGAIDQDKPATAKLRSMLAELKPPPVAPAPRPSPAPRPPQAPAESVVRNGITIAGETLTRGDAAVKIERLQAALLGQLLKVMPALLPFDRLAAKVYPGNRDGADLVRHLAEGVNPLLTPVRLTVKTVPKMGLTLFDTTE